MALGKKNEISVLRVKHLLHFSKNYAAATGYPVLNNTDSERL